VKNLKLRVFLLAVLILGWSALFFGQSSKPSDATICWREAYQHVRNAAASTDEFVAIGRKEDLAHFYNVKAMNELDTAIREYRAAADKLEELKNKIDHPYEARK
jgi:hypothetical protein